MAIGRMMQPSSGCCSQAAKPTACVRLWVIEDYIRKETDIFEEIIHRFRASSFRFRVPELLLRRLLIGLGFRV